MSKKFLAALIIGAAIALAAPAAANAVPYTHGGDCSISPSTVAAGGTSTMTCAPGTFKPSEGVQYVVSGKDASKATLSADPTATTAGGSQVQVTVPQDATGAYTVTATGASSQAASAVTVTVLPADVPASTSSSGSSTGLASTGSTIGWSIAWIGGALVVLGLIVLSLIAAARRRAHQS
ncbi:hypothetical protein ASE16_03310 [Leifsonia sp. Root227]|uniref:hypothetical protein n=1 Tax=unclassified Leifsonia TaxID=2663824 RepID=UPI0006F27C4A|nr:hypothetical protein [Leifsonia sp. Root227]KRC52096.1 hypothetical protein ASE16_03310 [Leifsonia sp. Root227]